MEIIPVCVTQKLRVKGVEGTEMGRRGQQIRGINMAQSRGLEADRKCPLRLVAGDAETLSFNRFRLESKLYWVSVS